MGFSSSGGPQRLPQPFRTALARALYGGVLTGASAGLGVYAVPPHSAEASAVAAGVALVGYLIHRGIAEGYVDST